MKSFEDRINGARHMWLMSWLEETPIPLWKRVFMFATGFKLGLKLIQTDAQKMFETVIDSEYYRKKIEENITANNMLIRRLREKCNHNQV